MDKMIPNEALFAYVTSSAFNLSLSRNMIAVLEEVAHNDHGRARHRMDRNNFVGPSRCLQERGLLVHRGKTVAVHGYSEPSFAELEGRSEYSSGITAYYRLTRAGWLAFDLLAEAGMVEPLPAKSPLRKLVAEDALLKQEAR